MTPNSTPKYFEKPQQPIKSWGSCPGMKTQQNGYAIPDCHFRLIFIFVVQLIYKWGDVMLHTVEQGMSSSAQSEHWFLFVFTGCIICKYLTENRISLSAAKNLFIMSGFPSLGRRTVHHTQHLLSLGGQISTLTSQMSTNIKQDGLILFNETVPFYQHLGRNSDVISEWNQMPRKCDQMNNFFPTWMNAPEFGYPDWSQRSGTSSNLYCMR